MSYSTSYGGWSFVWGSTSTEYAGGIALDDTVSYVYVTGYSDSSTLSVG